MSLCEARTFVPKGTPTTIEFVGGCRANSRFIPVCDPCRVIPYPNRVFNVLPGKQQRSYGKFLPGSLRAVFRFPEDNGEHRNAGKFCHSHFDSKHQRSKVRCFQSLCRRAQLARKCFRFVHVRNSCITARGVRDPCNRRSAVTVQGRRDQIRSTLTLKCLKENQRTDYRRSRVPDN